MVKINFGNVFIELQGAIDWVSSTEAAEPLARMANLLSKPPFYEYSPAHGAYGPLLAHQIARKLGGKVEIAVPEQATEEPEGIVF